MFSVLGILTPIEQVISMPLFWVTGMANDLSQIMTRTSTEITEIRNLRARNARLEETLSQFQAELITLREIEQDYNRLVELLDYTTTRDTETFIAADTIANADQSSQLRTMILNRGTRNGVDIGMAVVTDNGLVGRILEVSANASRVLLITDPISAVSVRLQESRAEGTIIGELSGNLRLTFVPLEADLNEGELVVTSGLGGNFPSGIAVGQVTSVQQFEFELYQEAQVRSLNDLDSLEVVLIVTDFEPIDLTVFETSP